MTHLNATPSGPANAIRAVVINLTRHSDRWKWVENNFRNVGVVIHRIEAIDASAPTAAEQIDNITIPDSGLSRAEAACILSHREAWRALLDSEEEFLAVFEDDVHVSADMSQLLNSQLLHAGMDLIKLEVPIGKVSYTHKAVSPYMGRALHRLVSKAYGAAGYIVSRRCATYLLEITERCNAPVDVILFDDKSPIWQKFIALQVVPAACVQDFVLSARDGRIGLFSSAIEEQRQQVKEERRNIKRKKKKSVPLKKLRHYCSCVLQGAHPLRYKGHVPLDLGFPGR